MDTGRLKTLIIIFFVILNLGLLILNYKNSLKFWVSDESIQNIEALLEQNGILLETSLPRDFTPKNRLSMTPYAFDMDKIRDIFFSQDEQPEKAVEHNRTIFWLDDRLLSFQNNLVYYENLSPTEFEGITDKESRQRTCDGIVAKIKELDPRINFTLDQSFEDEGYYILEYRGKALGYTIYSNYIRFVFTDSGIELVKFQFAMPVGFEGDRKYIYAPDEALLCLMYELRNIFGDEPEPTVVTGVDLVYYLESLSAQDSTQNATPYYRIYLAGQPEPFLINAYFNEIKY